MKIIIPHIYYVFFKDKKTKGIGYTYFGLHRSWESTWNRIRELGIDKNKKYIDGWYLTWKALFFILMPFKIFYKEDGRNEKII